MTETLRRQEDVYGQYTGHLITTERTKASKIKKKEYEKDGAKKIRKASMGMFYLLDDANEDVSSLEVVDKNNLEDDDSKDNDYKEESKAKEVKIDKVISVIKDIIGIQLAIKKQIGTN